MSQHTIVVVTAADARERLLRGLDLDHVAAGGDGRGLEFDGCQVTLYYKAGDGHAAYPLSIHMSADILRQLIQTEAEPAAVATGEP